MAITSVNTWAANDRLSKAQITQLDKNASYLLDKRAGHTDTLGSDLTFDVNGIVIGEASSLTMNDPANLHLPDGYLYTDAQLVGKTLPLRTGYVEITLPASGTYVLSAAQMACQHICFVGNVQQNSKVQFTHAIGWSKIIETRYSGQKTLELTCGDIWGGSTIVMQANQKSIIYGNDLDLIEVKNSSNIFLVDKVNMVVNGSIIPPLIVPTPVPAAIPENIPSSGTYNAPAGGIIASVANNTTNIIFGDLPTSEITFTNTTTTGKALFLDAKEGDQFELFLSCDVERMPGTENTVSWVSPLVSYGDTYNTDSLHENYTGISNPTVRFFGEAMVATVGNDYNQSAGRCIWTAPYDCFAEFKLFIYYVSATSFTTPGGFPTLVYSPLTYSIKQYRRI